MYCILCMTEEQQWKFLICVCKELYSYRGMTTATKSCRNTSDNPWTKFWEFNIGWLPEPITI